MTSERFQSLIERLKSPSKRVSILVAGDLCLDRYVFGSVDRISPEAPVPVLCQERSEERLGCMANVAVNIAALREAMPIHQRIYGTIGIDKEGERLSEALAKLGSEWTSLRLLKDSTRPTTQKTRFIAGSHHQMLRVDREECHALSAELQKQCLEFFAEDLKDAKLLILQDYAKGFFTEEFLSKAKALAKGLGVRTILDPNRVTPPEFYQGVSLITPNIAEAERLLDGRMNLAKGAEDKVIEAACGELKSKLHLEMCLITRSSHGMTLLDADDRISHFPAVARSVFDVTGAGDTVVGVIGAALAAGFSIEEACWLSTAAASVVVAKVGTATASTAEIINELQRLSEIAPTHQ